MEKRNKIIICCLLLILVAAAACVFVYHKKSSDQPAQSSIDASSIDVSAYEKPTAQKTFDKEYDVIVIGGEPEGVAAAVSAARNGAKTLLIEKREELGGLFTYGMLNFLDIPQGANKESVSKGIFREWHQMVGGGNAFGIEEAKAAFKKLADQEENLTLTTATEVKKAVKTNHQVTGVKIKNAHGKFEVQGKTFIDATQDADFAVMAGAPYFVGGEDIGIANKKMAVTLMIHLKDVDWDGIKKAAKSQKFGEAEVSNNVAWGFSKLHTVYKPVEENTRLRGLNIAKFGNDYYINALQIFGVDGLDETSKAEAIEKGKRETKHILKYLQKEFPGFEKAKIADYPTELYVRETRHIKAEYQLAMSDVWTNRDQWDAVAYGAYPVDVQAQTTNDYGYVLSKPTQYAIPFRSLVPQNVDGLLVVGRSAGYSSLAAGSARVVPTGMTTGEAAGTAAALALKNDVTVREISQDKALIKKLQNQLEKQETYVKSDNVTYPYKGEWYDESIQTLMDYGLVVAGYTNDLQVDKEATVRKLVNLIRSGLMRADTDMNAELKQRVNAVHTDVFAKADGPITRDEAAKILADIVQISGSGNEWDELVSQGYISEDIAKYIPPDGSLTNKDIYAISASFIEKLALQK